MQRKESQKEAIAVAAGPPHSATIGIGTHLCVSLELLEGSKEARATFICMHLHLHREYYINRQSWSGPPALT